MRILITVKDRDHQKRSFVLLQAEKNDRVEVLCSHRQQHVTIDGRACDQQSLLIESGIREGSIVVVESHRRQNPNSDYVTGDADRHHLVGAPDSSAIPAHVEFQCEEGKLLFSRPPAALHQRGSKIFQRITHPKEEERKPMSWMGAVLPVGGAVLMSVLYKNPAMMLFGVFSFAMFFGSFLVNRRSTRRTNQQTSQTFRIQCAEIESEILQEILAQKEELFLRYPDGKTVSEIVNTPSTRLWERHHDHPSWLSVRVGVSKTCSAVSVIDPNLPDHRQQTKMEFDQAPTLVSLSQSGVVGVAKSWQDQLVPSSAIGDIVHWLCLQIATFHAPQDVGIYVFSLSSASKGNTPHRDYRHKWESLLWLPHVMSFAPKQCLRAFACERETVSYQVAELLRILKNRQQNKTHDQHRFCGDIVLVLDEPHRLREIAGIQLLLQEGPQVGIYALCVEKDERLLPQECKTTLVVHTHYGVLRNANSFQHQERIALDVYEKPFFEQVARALAPCVEMARVSNDAQAYQPCRLSDMFGEDIFFAQGIVQRWSAKAVTNASLPVALGKAFGETFYCDLVKDGPHMLIGGTTGSGKSELLQTIIASLALTNTPQQVNFLLIDYKGGAAFRQCERLKHTVGLVTDLDAHLVERALASLSAELVRRERMLARESAHDLETYNLAMKQQRNDPLARLVVCVDEFASLVYDLPDFMEGLVSIAQRGRSLGIHLILATQRPSGVVSPDIRANANIRIALRMTSAAESVDVLEMPDAAFISPQEQGRAYISTGQKRLSLFQTAYVGARRQLRFDAQTKVESLSIGQIGSPKDVTLAVQSQQGRTDLEVLVEQINTACELLAFESPRTPWTAPLVSDLSLHALLERAQSQATRTDVWFGMEDHPHLQRQTPARIDLDTFDHLAIVGCPRSGKTTALRTLFFSAIAHLSPKHLHVYAIDFTSGGLSVLEHFVHVGGVVQRSDLERSQRLIRYLVECLRHRQERSGCNEEYPHIWLLIDSWEGCLAACEEAQNLEMIEHIYVILREGAAVGVHVIVSGQRSLAIGKMAYFIERKIFLRQSDPNDYLLAGLQSRHISRDLDPGRGFFAGDATEIQIAWLGEEQQDKHYVREYASVVNRAYAHVSTSLLPISLPTFPFPLHYADVQRECLDRKHGNQLVLGLAGNQIKPFSINIAQQRILAFVGGARSGKSNALKVVIEDALARGYRVCVFSSQLSALRVYEHHPDVEYILENQTNAHVGCEDFIRTAQSHSTQHLVVIDDIDLLDQRQLLDVVEREIKQPLSNNTFFVCSASAQTVASAMGGLFSVLRKQRYCIFLQPQEMHTVSLFGFLCTRADINVGIPPGRGFAFLPNGESVQVQIGLVRQDQSKR